MLHDFRNRGFGEFLRIVGLAGQGVGDVDGAAVKQADQLLAEPGRAVLTAPQLRVFCVRSARRDGAVDQAHSPLDPLDGLLGVWRQILLGPP